MLDEHIREKKTLKFRKVAITFRSTNSRVEFGFSAESFLFLFFVLFALHCHDIRRSIFNVKQSIWLRLAQFNLFVANYEIHSMNMHFWRTSYEWIFDPCIFKKQAKQKTMHTAYRTHKYQRNIRPLKLKSWCVTIQYLGAYIFVIFSTLSHA